MRGWIIIIFRFGTKAPRLPSMSPPFEKLWYHREPANFPYKRSRAQTEARDLSHPTLQIPAARATAPAAHWSRSHWSHRGIALSPPRAHGSSAAGPARICHDTEAREADLASVSVTGKCQVRSGEHVRKPRRIMRQHNGWLFWQEAADFSRPDR